MYRSFEEDGRRILAFLSEIALHPAYVNDVHVGDFSWHGWRGHERPWSEVLGIWEDAEGAIAGLGWFDPPGELEISVHPRFLGTEGEADLTRQIVAWGEPMNDAQRTEATAPLGITVRENDPFRQDVIGDLGYRYTGRDSLMVNERPLDGATSVPELPEGYRFVAMTEDTDFAERTDIHREVWAPSRLTLDGYRTLRTAPAYDPHLDMVVQAPDGRYAVYVHGWYDPVSRVGLLEPVGCRAEFRGRRLTSTLIHELLRRFVERGATRAVVTSDPENDPATALYRSTGFTQLALMQWWTREGT